MLFRRRECSRCRTSSTPSSTCVAPWTASPAQRCSSSFERRELIGLAIYDAGSRSFYNVRRPVHEPADLHGLKIRVPPSDIFIAAIAALGGNPTPLPFGEVYSAMQTHLIEGAENNWRTFHTSRQFEVARYWSQSDHSYSPEALLLSKRTYDALSPRDREIVVEAARESVPYMRTLWDKMEAESRAAGPRRRREGERRGLGRVPQSALRRSTRAI